MESQRQVCAVWFGLCALVATGCSEQAQFSETSTGVSSTEQAVEAQPSAEDLSGGGTVQILELTGDVRAHDPSMIRHGTGDWYVFSTGDAAVGGGAIQIRRSSNLRAWSFAGTVFNAIPAWVTAAVPGVTNLWAPEIILRNGTYYLYYSGSTFGSNRSVIGLATNQTLNPSAPNYAWVDQGQVFSSSPANDYNAIEAPFVLARSGWYYLFVSLDFCCQGSNSTYKVAVGRARQPTGPYFDRLGTPLQHGGGTVILSERGDMIGPGGQSVSPDGWFVHHWYNRANNGEIRLGIRKIVWETSGWPRVTNP